MQNHSIELEPIDRFINCVVQFFELLFGQNKIVSDHFFEIGFAGLICVDVFVDNMSYVFDRVNVMDSLVFLMVFDAAFRFADCACAGA
jgi:hypothetical protein